MCGEKTLILVLSSLVLVSSALVSAASNAKNPYGKISERNVFDLRPAPPVHITRPEPPPLPKITLTGITTILGNKRVLITVAGPGKTVQSYMLTEGQGEDEIEVLRIDEEKATVEVRNHGTVQTLSLEELQQHTTNPH